MPPILRLLAHDSLDVRISAGRLTALLYTAIHRASSGVANGASGDSDSELGGEASAYAASADLPEVTDDVVELLSDLASDASKSQSRNKRREQRTYFRKFLATVEVSVALDCGSISNTCVLSLLYPICDGTTLT